TLAASHDRVVVSGGLGITRDDLTRAAVATSLGVDIVVDSPSLEVVQRRVASRGRPFEPALQGHATHPATTRVIDNPVGLASGVEWQQGRAASVALPGVPAEFEAMVPHWIHDTTPSTNLTRRFLTVFGIGEREIDARLETLAVSSAIHLGICPLDGPVEV